jgi:FkbM family methyltransferase
MIDVGANIGDTAAFVAELMPDARVLCIEGSDRYVDLLRSNVHRLGLNAECVQAYCGDGGEGGFVSEEESGTGRLRAVSPNPSSVRTQTLDEIVSAHPEFSRPALLKIDTDGFDAKVLRGARRLLEESHPVVFFEFAESLLWEAGESPSTIFPMLAQLGYARARVYSHEGIAAGTFDLSDPALMSDVEGVSRDAGYCDVLVWTEPLRAVLEPGVV